MARKSGLHPEHGAEADEASNRTNRDEFLRFLELNYVESLKPKRSTARLRPSNIYRREPSPPKPSVDDLVERLQPSPTVTSTRRDR
jgi:hypothetical protein